MKSPKPLVKPKKIDKSEPQKEAEGEGQNKHGKILMRVREALKEKAITVVPMDKYL